MIDAARLILMSDPEKLAREGIGLAALCVVILSTLCLPALT